MVSATVGGVDAAQGVGSVRQLLQLGAEQPAAVDAGASLPAGRHPTAAVIHRRRDPEAGQMQGAGCPVPLVQAGLPDRGKRRDGPLLVQEQALPAR